MGYYYPMDIVANGMLCTLGAILLQKPVLLVL